MAMTESDKRILKKQLSPTEVTHRYQQAIKYFIDGGKTGLIDDMEYRAYQDLNVKRDLKAAAHAWFTMVLTWEEYYNIVQGIVGFDLMIQGIVANSRKAKKNGEEVSEKK